MLGELRFILRSNRSAIASELAFSVVTVVAFVSGHPVIGACGVLVVAADLWNWGRARRSRRALAD